MNHTQREPHLETGRFLFLLTLPHLRPNSVCCVSPLPISDYITGLRSDLRLFMLIDLVGMGRAFGEHTVRKQ